MGEEIDLHRDVMGSIYRIQPIYFHLNDVHVNLNLFDMFASVI